MLQCRFDTTLSHSQSQKKGKRPKCALHAWAGTKKRREIKYCEMCNVHLCIDCFPTFHTNFDLVAVEKQLHKKDLKKLVPLKTDPERVDDGTTTRRVDDGTKLCTRCVRGPKYKHGHDITCQRSQNYVSSEI